jgi:hypothetical protein
MHAQATDSGEQRIAGGAAIGAMLGMGGVAFDSNFTKPHRVTFASLRKFDDALGHQVRNGVIAVNEAQLPHGVLEDVSEHVDLVGSE